MWHKQTDIAPLVAPIIRQAGALLLAYFHQPLSWTVKQDKSFVTQADLASERYLIEQLTKLMPDAQFYAEESGASGQGNSPYCWVIDPLDGTTNFAHGLPYFCISVALTYNNEPIFGMIYQPLTNELMHGQQGRGAFINDEPIKTSSLEFPEAVVALGLPYLRQQEYTDLLEKGREIAKQAYAIRHFGAVALDIAYLACGRLEGVVLRKLGWWDVAAGIVIVQEAGGVMSDFEGKVVGPNYRSFVAACSPQVHQKLLNLLK